MRNPFPKLASALIALALPITFAACSGDDDPGPGPGPVAVESVSIAPDTLNLKVGGAVGTLAATVLPAGASDKAVTWTIVPKTGVATVAASSSGASAAVTAVANGTATITVTTADGGKTATCPVTVTTPAAGVELSADAVELRPKGLGAAIVATVLPESASDKTVIWSSSDAGVATVSEGGLVLGLAVGGAVITATTADGGHTATCGVTVRHAPFSLAAKTVAASSQHFLAIKEDGTLWGMGHNYSGQLGIGDIKIGVDYGDGVNVLTQVGEDDDWVSVDTAQGASYAFKADGSLWGWGNSYSGAWGIPSIGDYQTVPVQIAGPGEYASVSPGGGYALAIKTDGTLWAWGSNSSYSSMGIGPGDGLFYNAPVQVGTDSDWAFVTCGWIHTMAVKKDGSLWGWGYNGDGDLGTGSTTPDVINVPTRIGDGSNDWAAADLAYRHSMAFKTDGSLWGCGYNNDGQTGNGAPFSGPRVLSFERAGDDVWTNWSTGTHHNVAVRDDGSLWGWGNGGYGLFGGGLPIWTTNFNTPTRVGTENDWAIAEAASGMQGYFTVAIKTDGSLWTVGQNQNGVLGPDYPMAGQGGNYWTNNFVKQGEGFRVPAK